MQIYQWIGPFGDIKSLAICAPYKKDLPKAKWHWEKDVRIRMGMETLWFRLGSKGGFILKDGAETDKLVTAFSVHAGHVIGPRDMEADRANRTSGDWREIVKDRIQAELRMHHYKHSMI